MIINLLRNSRYMNLNLRKSLKIKNKAKGQNQKEETNNKAFQSQADITSDSIPMIDNQNLNLKIIRDPQLVRKKMKMEKMRRKKRRKMRSNPKLSNLNLIKMIEFQNILPNQKNLGKPINKIRRKFHSFLRILYHQASSNKMLD